MPLTTLVTNEVKLSDGSELEMSRIGTIGRTFEFAMISEVPNLPIRIFGSHKETGTGLKLKRSSMIRGVYTSLGVDGNPVQSRSWTVLEIPVGNLSSMTPAKHALSMVGSLIYTNASSTFVYAGTGNGAAVLLNGEI